jgi:uncharacterized protein YktA (UPF0223 family)
MSHYDLCKLTAKWTIKNRADVALFDYQSWATNEFPDCLSFSGFHTWLYEIKVSREDFLKDKKKEARIIGTSKERYAYEWEIARRKSAYEAEVKIKNFQGGFHDFIKKYFPKNLIVEEAEHARLGKYRFYVCPAELIKIEEVGHWGLLWFKNGRFTMKKESATFKRSMMEEQSILVHAIRKLKHGSNDQVLTKYFNKIL